MSTYCIATHVPIYTDGSRNFVKPDWHRALLLLRDSLMVRFTRFRLVAPSKQPDNNDIFLHEIGIEDGFDVLPSIPRDITKKGYFLGGGRRKWKLDVHEALKESHFAHTAISDLYKPFGGDALRCSFRRKIPCAFFVDTDVIEQQKQLISNGVMRSGPDRFVYRWLYEKNVRDIVAQADVSMLKGSALMSKYAAYARNPQCFQDTSYQSAEVASEEILETRFNTRPENSLRLVYCGRLVERKGCAKSIEIITQARAAGANISLDFIGAGESRSALEKLVYKKNASESIRFLGEAKYNKELIKRLSTYDALFFTPIAEDTPRMIFDGFAAGLPLVANDIPYVRERSLTDGATFLLPSRDSEKASERLVELAFDANKLEQLSWEALKAGRENAADVWYRRRAEWTIEAFENACPRTAF